MAQQENNLRKKAVLIVLLALPVSVYLAAVFISGEVSFRSLDYVGPREVVVNENGVEETVYYHVPEFSFTDQDGNTVTNETMKGKVYVASFFFTSCPTICTPMNFHLKDVYDRFYAYPDIAFVSHTIDPMHDSVSVLKSYALERGVRDSDKWHFVTGAKDDIYSMAASYFLAANEDTTLTGHAGFYHSGQVMIVDWEGRIRSGIDEDGNPVGAYEMTEPKDIDQLVDDLKVLVKEYRKVKMGA